MTLQPVVENAVMHGLELKKKQGVVIVSVEGVYDELEIHVRDNGTGMDRETLARINERLDHPEQYDVQTGEHTGIALSNVCRRIQLHFGGNYGMHAFSTPDVGTEILILIPLTYGETQ